MPAPSALFAPCPRGVEPLLAGELASLGAAGVTPTVAGVSFLADLEGAYRACLWSRLANRVLLPLATFEAVSPEELYAAARAVPWEDHLAPGGTLAVDVPAAGDAAANTLYAAQRVKDAVVDRLRELRGSRPSVDLSSPDLRIHLSLRGPRATLSLDLAGGSLHRRGYRSEGGAAPLKENLAAAILVRAGWPEVAAAGGPFLDPMCGSGTLPVEAALMAGDVAPGLLRSTFGFLRWPGHDAEAWRRLLEEARGRREAGLPRLPAVHGSDRDPAAVRAALANAGRAGLEGKVVISRRELAAAAPPAPGHGLLAVNPPYGERLGSEGELRPLYEELGRILRERFMGWRAAVFTGNPDLALRLGLRARRRHVLFNGPLRCVLFGLDVEKGRFMHAAAPPAKAGGEALPEGAAMLANRLRKNLRTIGAWARREGVDCFRLYDADIPEYAVAVDVYGDAATGRRWAVVQEYEAPATVDPARARARLREVTEAVPAALDIPAERMVLKIRRRQRGRSQYGRQGEERRTLEVREGGLRFQVNLTDYLDTGLFLDHRPTRAMLRDLAAGGRFLNLFCYTGAATVYAAAGGAGETVSVDLSNTYLEWARRNLALNGFSGKHHRLVRADVRRWVESERSRYGLVFLDPPTFSSSKAMEGTLDIQRDHVGLIRAAARLLEPGGILVFSTNHRRFKLDPASLAGLEIEDVTARTIPRDFARDPRIHSCWTMRHRR